MNWIKEHTFIFGLAVATFVAAFLLWIFGSAASKSYDAAKEEFDSAAEEATRFEKLEPYPSAGNLASKKLALEEYAEQAAELEKSFDKYRPESTENISVQAFADAAKRANEETRKAFGKDFILPEEYYCGFSDYKAGSPPGNVTAILYHQLKAIEAMMLRLSESGATRLVNIHRPRLPEEDGKKYSPEDGAIARNLPLEIVFEGSESAVRQFLNSLVNDKQYYLVVRSLRINNKKQLPPRTTDAKFESSPQRPAGGGGGGAGAAPADFNALFGGDPPQPGTGDATEPKPEAAPVVPPPAAPAPGPADSSRILQQVLGQEELQVFVRLDILWFLEPSK